MEGRRPRALELRGGTRRGYRGRSRSRRGSRRRDSSRRHGSHRESRGYRKRFRSPSPKADSASYSSCGRRSASYGSSCSSSNNNNNGCSHSEDGSAGFNSKHRRWSPERHGGGDEKESTHSKRHDAKDSSAALDRPTADWVCGVCSNPNSVNREACYRCGTAFAVGVNAVPSDEVKVSNIPNGLTFGEVEQALSALFSQRGESCRISAHDACEVRASNNCWDVYVLFDSVVEATKALTYARSMLSLGESQCPMRFSLQGRAKRKLNKKLVNNGRDGDGRGRGVSLLPAPPPPVEGLPDHLQPAVWRPVETFPSIEAEMEYLDMLTRHWSKLSQSQKDYYDERVQKALSAQRRRQPLQQTTDVVTSPGSCSAGNESGASRTPSQPENGSSPQNVGRCPEGKRETAPGLTEPPKAAASLKERLAMKKAQLSSGVKTGTAHERDHVAATNNSLSSSAVPAHSAKPKEPVSSQQHLFYGFPIPPRFPTKTDYLLNSKSLPFRAGVIFRYVPPAVAERILQPPVSTKPV